MELLKLFTNIYLFLVFTITEIKVQKTLKICQDDIL